MDMSKIWGNIYDRSVAILLGTVVFEIAIFVLFGDFGNLFFDKKLFKILYQYFLFIQKTAELVLEKLHNSGFINRRKLPDTSLRNVFNLPSIALRFTLSFEWPDFGLKYLVTVIPQKFKANVWNVPISETGSRCNSVFRHNDSNWVIIMELERKVEYSWAYTFWVSVCFKRYRSLPWTWDGVSIRFQLQLVWRVRRFFIFFYIFNMSLFKT